MSRKVKLLQLTASVNLWLKKVIGAENIILYHFAQFGLVAIIVVLLVSVAVWIAAVLFQVASIILAALVVALPYLLSIAVIVCVVALLICVYRIRTSKRRRKVQRQSEVVGQNAPHKQAEAHQTDEEVGIRQSLLAADQQTWKSLESVLASLQRFDHRLELVITPAHYADVFGDNWVIVREFVESSQGRSVPEVSAKLLEIIILYRRAQEVRWVPINDERVHAWWKEASRRRKWLSDEVDATARGSGPNGPKAASSADISFVSSSSESDKRLAPKLSAPPTVDELVRYYEWVGHRSEEPRR